MVTLKDILKESIQGIVKQEFNVVIDSFEIQKTRKEFAGDLTLVVFPMIRTLKQKPEQIARSIGDKLVQQEIATGFNIVKGFLNLELNDELFTKQIVDFKEQKPEAKSPQMVEYSSPNTNKPIHLGHIRNNLLGFSIANILKAAGHPTKKIQIINDRGIHICKSMWAWQQFANGETPESARIKGDHLVGKYYVKFNEVYEKEVAELINKGETKEDAKKQAPSLKSAQEMLRKWEANDKEVRALWQRMNQWVYDGFNATYKNLGVDFDEVQYESNTYILGKSLVETGLQKGVFFKKDDGSVWCDLTKDGLDEKLLLRSDGTAVYMTQDLGTAVERFKEFDIEGLTYVVGNEQDYHFKVLFLILKKLGFDWANQLHHLSYGMVDLPQGKMKSREGTVVDADDLMQEMTATAESISKESGKLQDLEENAKKELYKAIGLGALKYYILKVDPKKRILFDPKESIDFNGDTGPFLQYTHARICSLLSKAKTIGEIQIETPNEEEKELIIQLNEYKEVIQKSAKELSPSLVANYLFDLVKSYNRFYQAHKILHNDVPEGYKNFRLKLSELVGSTLKNGLNLLGISAPERM